MLFLFNVKYLFLMLISKIVSKLASNFTAECSLREIYFLIAKLIFSAFCNYFPQNVTIFVIAFRRINYSCVFQCRKSFDCSIRTVKIAESRYNIVICLQLSIIVVIHEDCHSRYSKIHKWPLVCSRWRTSANFTLV